MMRSSIVGGAVPLLAVLSVMGCSDERPAEALGQRSDALYFRNEQRLEPPGLESESGFGAYANAVDGTRIVAAFSGQIFVWELQGGNWTLADTVDAPVATSDNEFASSVALDGDRMVVGGKAAVSGVSGTAYVMVKTAGSWQLEQQLDPPALRPVFGHAVEVQGGRIAVAAGSGNAGGVYLFALDNGTWIADGHVNRTSPKSDDSYGAQLSLLDDRLAVSASGAGMAFVYRRDNGSWEQEFEISGSEGVGHDVSLSGERLLVGNGNGLSSHSARVYLRSGTSWAQEQQLVPNPNPPPAAALAFSASLSGDVAMLGTPGYNGVYVFKRTPSGWEEQHLLQNVQAGWLGFSVDFDGTTLIAGAPKANGPTTFESGALFVYDGVEVGPGETCSQDAECSTGHCSASSRWSRASITTMPSAHVRRRT